MTITSGRMPRCTRTTSSPLVLGPPRRADDLPVEPFRDPVHCSTRASRSGSLFPRKDRSAAKRGSGSTGAMHGGVERIVQRYATRRSEALGSFDDRRPTAVGNQIEGAKRTSGRMVPISRGLGVPARQSHGCAGTSGKRFYGVARPAWPRLWSSSTSATHRARGALNRTCSRAGGRPSTPPRDERRARHNNRTGSHSRRRRRADPPSILSCARR